MRQPARVHRIAQAENAMTAPEKLLKQMPSGVHEAVRQMFLDGPVWDGNLVCKTSRTWLVSQGYAERSDGYNFLTAAGVALAVSLGHNKTGRKSAWK